MPDLSTSHHEKFVSISYRSNLTGSKARKITSCYWLFTSLYDCPVYGERFVASKYVQHN